MAGTRPLRVLLVEDSEDDAALELLELRRSGYEVHSRRVDDREELIAALAEETWDVVLCDHAMPAFNSTRALEVLRERGLDVPLIIVSGMIGEDVAVEALKEGASDYVLKGGLRRLGPAVARALREAEERRRLGAAEERLRRSHERQRLLLEALPLALYSARRAPPSGTTWISDNAERLTGFPAARFTSEEGLRASRIHEADREAFRRALEGLGREGIAVVEYRWQTADGRWRWFLDHAVAVDTGDGRPAEILGVWLDVTDRKTLQQQFQHAQRMEAVGRLAGGIAHDFNNLLTVILGYTDILVQTLPESGPHRQQAAEVRRAGERASSLTRQLLAFSRKQVLELRPVNVSALVAEMEKMIRRLVGEDMRLQVRLDPDPGWIRADPGQVEQVLMNLVVNARDAMPRGGTLEIRTGRADLDGTEEDGLGGRLRPGPHVALEVTDTGIGMDEETRVRIFEPFFTTKSAGKGTGLGLATVHGVVVQGGGQIALRTAPGQGSSFRVYLPRVEAAAPAPAPAAPERPRARAGGTVLLVEDDAAIRVLVADTLAAAGFRVEAAGSAEAALAFALERPQEPIALLLTDLVLPGANGLELSRRFRAARPGVPILGMTGYVDRVEFEGSIGTDLDGILQKPFRPGTVLLRVSELVAGSG